MTVCGDHFLEAGEECEEDLFRDETCQSFGFSDGELGCDDSCEITTDDCSGVEDCFDGQDNDGDGLSDCLDPIDCGSVCGDACEAPSESLGGVTANGTTAGRGNVFDSSCSDTDGGGTEVVYKVVAAVDGKIDVNLITSDKLNLSVMTVCGDPGSELACSPARRMSLEAFEGEEFYVTIEGDDAGEVGGYFLEVASRVPACGDGVRDSDEECDDFNTQDGDGCDENCFLEPDETEPNGALDNASPIVLSTTTAEIRPANDEDVFVVETTAESSTIVANTFHLGDGACSYNLMDTHLAILGENGTDVLASDDNGGDGLCARAVASALPPGTYFIRVSATAGANPATFPYLLDVELGECGNADQSAGEECDDGNVESGDGCSSDCEVEP